MIIFILGKRKIFYDRKTLKFEHFPDEFSLEFPRDEVDMEMFDTPICHGFPCTGEIIMSTIEPLHKKMNGFHF